ncbi:hypothetical protein MMC22_002663 [Lobaria immixta]|nr:hypothetical protein [Lobaria immixta]
MSREGSAGAENMDNNPLQPTTHDISRIEYHIKDVKALGELVTAAAAAAFPNRGRSRYKEAHVLLLSWEDDDLGVIDEIIDLQTVFEETYRFQTERWKIPARESHFSLTIRLMKFLTDFKADDNLLVVYYGGHGGMNEDRQSSENKQRSIVIEPMQVQTELTSEYPETPNPPSLSKPSVPSVASQQEVDMLSSESSQSPLPDVWPDPNFKCPKVVISIALEEDQRLRPDELTEWLRSVPALANFVHVEGVYESDSVMIILSLPVAIWNLMPDDPAVSFIGFIRSRNMSMIAENESTKFKVTTKEDIKKTVTPLQNPEVIRLMRTFVTEIAIHLDFIDPAKYFSVIIPVKSLHNGMLWNACLTCAKGPFSFAKCDLASGKIREILALDDPHRDSQHRAIVAIILFMSPFMMDESFQTRETITTTGEFVAACGWNSLSPGIGSACFWLHASQEVLSCLHLNQVTTREPDTWGLQISFFPTGDQVWVYRILYILAKSVNLRARQSKLNEDGDLLETSTAEAKLQEWEELSELCNLWSNSIPETMFRLIDSGGRVYRSNFPDTLLLTQAAKIGQLFYHLTCYVIARCRQKLIIRDGNGDEVLNENLSITQLSHSRQICGIVAHTTKDRGITNVASFSLVFVADALTKEEEQKECYLILNKIRYEAGWKTSRWNDELPRLWKWTEGFKQSFLQDSRQTQYHTKAKAKAEMQKEKASWCLDFDEAGSIPYFY